MRKKAINEEELTLRNWRDYVVLEENIDLPTKDEKPTLGFHEENAKDKIKAIFFKIDTSEDGYMELDEFRKFVCEELEVNMEDKEFNKLCDDIDKDKSGKIDFEEFYDYYITLIRANKEMDETREHIRDSLSTNSHLKKINDQTQETKRRAKLQSLAKELLFKAKSSNNKEMLSLLDSNKSLKEANSVHALNNRLLSLYADQDVEEISDFIADRWSAFTNFTRQGSSGKNVMTSSEDACDALPGEYDLVELVMNQYGQVPEKKVPKHAVLKPVVWEKAEEGVKSGKLICPSDWNGHIPIDFGTNQFLAYYDACLAGEKQVKVGLLQRHGTVDFTYSKDYHDNYVMESAGGNGIEIHAFHHMDCPLDDDSGFFILGKWNSPDEIHLTAFYIPKNHVLYVPPNTIHSNDHLKGPWRTMLSDCSTAPIDHVIFNSKINEDELEPLDIKFDASLVHFHNHHDITVCTLCDK